MGNNSRDNKIIIFLFLCLTNIFLSIILCSEKQKKEISMLDYRFYIPDDRDPVNNQGQNCVNKCKITLAAREKELAKIKANPSVSKKNVLKN